jgi:hypothetical protein
VQLVGGPQSPLALQVWKVELLEHCVAPGTHTPVHAPFTHAEFVHADSGPHAPFESQVCQLLPEHRVAPGVQTPAHAPATHA